MVGVYCYYKDSKPIYVGCSIDLERRKKQHGYNNRFLDCEYKILEETTIDILYERERYWIRELKTFEDGENKVIHNNMDLPEVRKLNSNRMKINNPMKPGMTNKGSFVKGQKPKITEERNKKISERMKGPNNPMFGKKGGFDHINSILKECEKCGKLIGPGNYVRWHGKKCKEVD
jgi:hypothetical protein